MRFYPAGPECELVDIAYHRNGIGGEGFHFIVFRWFEPEDSDGESTTWNLAAVVFDTPGRVAVINPSSAAQMSASSKWRGDWFEPVLRSMIQAHQEEQHAANVRPA